MINLQSMQILHAKLMALQLLVRLHLHPGPKPTLHLPVLPFLPTPTTHSQSLSPIHPSPKIFKLMLTVVELPSLTLEL